MICELYKVVGSLLQIYFFIMLVYALLSWVPQLRGRWSDYVTRLVEPVLTPVRRIIPPVAGFDISFIIVILVVQWAASQALAQSRLCYF